MDYPNPRGCLSASKSKFIRNTVTEEATNDFRAHFPAGDRDRGPGGGRRYQKSVVAPNPWTPYEPLDPRHQWKFGVCGDKVDGNEHLKGGEYYNNATIVATYKQGGVIDVGLTMVAHHNGFMELHICDVAKCPGGDISQRCFALGHCRQLKRRKNRICDSGQSKDCGPIDRNYPGRWYLPCSRENPRIGYEFYGSDGTILYELPEDLTCEHCVIQWYWTAANFCNPPGTVEYFQGPDAPQNWGRCRGQAGSVGGFNANKRECGTRFPEEYAQCADIRVEPRKGTVPRESSSASFVPSATSIPSSDPPPTPMPPVAAWTPEPSASTPPMAPMPEANAPDNRRPQGDYKYSRGQRQGHGGVRDIVLVADGMRILSLNQVKVVDVSKYKHVTVEAIVEDGVSKVSFQVGRKRHVDLKSPFYLFGDTNGVPIYDDDQIVNKDVMIRVRANGDSDRVSIRLYK